MLQGTRHVRSSTLMCCTNESQQTFATCRNNRPKHKHIPNARSHGAKMGFHPRFSKTKWPPHTTNVNLAAQCSAESEEMR